MPGIGASQTVAAVLQVVQAGSRAIPAAKPYPSATKFAFFVSVFFAVAGVWTRKLTPSQFFWLMTVLVAIFFMATVMFAIKYL